MILFFLSAAQLDFSSLDGLAQHIATLRIAGDNGILQSEEERRITFITAAVWEMDLTLTPQLN